MRTSRRLALVTLLTSAALHFACTTRGFNVGAGGGADGSLSSLHEMPASQNSAQATLKVAGLKELIMEQPYERTREKSSFVARLTVDGGREVRIKVDPFGDSSFDSCKYPKLRLEDPTGRFQTMLVTHCGLPAGYRDAFGRTGNEHAVHREFLAYRIQQTMGLDAFQTRFAKVSYLDCDAEFTQCAPLDEDKAGFFLEHASRAGKRAGGTLRFFANGDGKPEHLALAREFPKNVVARTMLFQALIGNLDWSMNPLDGGTAGILGNMAVLERQGASTPWAFDFDTAAFVAEPSRLSQDRAGDFRKLAHFRDAQGGAEAVKEEIAKVRGMFDALRAEVDGAPVSPEAKKDALEAITSFSVELDRFATAR